MSGHELKHEQVGSIRRLTREQKAQAALRLARHAVAAGETSDDIETFLQMLGLLPTVSGGRTTPIGDNVPPKVRQHRRDQSKARRRASRNDGKETP